MATSPSHLTLFVALEGSKEELGLPASNFWITPGPHHDEYVAEYTRRCTTGAFEALDFDFPAVYLSFPSAKDPLWAERLPGKSTAHVIAEAPWAAFERWEDCRVKRRGAEYEALKAQLTRKLLDAMLKQFPHLAERVAFTELGTPLSNAFYLSSSRGASWGLAHTPKRFAQAWIRPHTPIKGFFLTGQDLVSVGVCGALVGGFLSAIAVHPLVAWKYLRVLTHL